MSLGEFVINFINKRRDKNQKKSKGPYGDFYRNGGNELLYDVPVKTGNIVIDVGGYKGEWTATMIARYGCRSEIFEPFPSYFEECKKLFSKNTFVRVHPLALGSSSRTTKFSFAANGTSEFIVKDDLDRFEVKVMDVSTFFDQLDDESVACLKLNIEGGEYEVLERLLATKQIKKCRCLLIQFHAQPLGWERRLKDIEVKLRLTHTREWCFPMIWEKWVRQDTVQI